MATCAGLSQLDLAPGEGYTHEGIEVIRSGSKTCGYSSRHVNDSSFFNSHID